MLTPTDANKGHTVQIRSIDALIGPAVAAAIQELQHGDLSPRDLAAVRLAERYAAAIDDSDDPADALERLGPKLLATLEQLGATPKARAAITKGTPAGGTNRIDALRAAR